MMGQLLPHASGVAQRHVALHHGHRRQLPGGHSRGAHPAVGAARQSAPRLRARAVVSPRRRVVGLAIGAPAGKQAAFRVEAELAVQHVGGVGEVEHVLMLPLIVLDDVVHKAVQEGHHGARPHGHKIIGTLGRSDEVVVHDNPRGTLGAGAVDPRLRRRVQHRIGPQGQHRLGMGDRAQRRRGGRRSDGGRAGQHTGRAIGARLAVETGDAPAAQQLSQRKLLFGRQARPAEAGPAVATVDRRLAVLLHEGLVADALHPVGDLIQRRIPFEGLPVRRSRAAHQGPRHAGQRVAGGRLVGAAAQGRRLHRTASAEAAAAQRMGRVSRHRYHLAIGHRAHHAAPCGAARAHRCLRRLVRRRLFVVGQGSRRRRQPRRSHARRRSAHRAEEPSSRQLHVSCSLYARSHWRHRPQRTPPPRPVAQRSWQGACERPSSFNFGLSFSHRSAARKPSGTEVPEGHR